MVTPDFEDWLARQDIPVTEDWELETYQTYLTDTFGIKNGSLTVAEGVWFERYKGLSEYDIRPIERHYLYMGEPFVETRYAIKGLPGLWGKFRAYEIAEERAIEAGEFEIAERLHSKYEEMLKYPERRRVRYEE